MSKIYTEEIILKLLQQKTPDLVKTGDYDKDDGYSKSKNVRVEIKCRNKHYDLLTIDKTKWDYLKQFKRCRYIVSTPKGIWSWNLHKIEEPIWNKRLAPASTFFHQEVDQVYKTFGYLDIKDAKDITNI